MKNQKPVVAEILDQCKLMKLKHENNIETLVIYWPGGYTAMISRISHFFQLYLRGFGHNMYIGNVDDIESADQFFELAAEYKERLESGEVIRIVETLPGDEDLEDAVDNILKLSGDPQFIVIHMDTHISTIFDTKAEVVEFIGCSRVSVDQVLNGKSPSVKRYMIKRIT